MGRPPKQAALDQKTEYERQQEENIERNRLALLELMGAGEIKVASGDAMAISALGIAPPPMKRKKAAAKPKRVAVKADKDDGEEKENTVEARPVLGTRRSARNAGKPATSYAGDGDHISDRSKLPVIVSQPGKKWDDDDSDDEERGERGGTVRVNKLVGRVHNPKTFGLIPGVRIGTWWETRAECSGDAIHAPFVAGIAGGPKGAYSVALSGGYADDVDLGEAFTYTGSGGRDLKGTKTNPKNLRTAPQSSHQTFEHSFNNSLLVSSQTKKPVRVIRGFKLPSKYAPKSGYRYDGIYVVEKAWIEPGNNPGRFNVCKFAFRRLPGQPSIPERSATSDEDEEEEDEKEEVESEDEEEVEEKAESEEDKEDLKEEDKEDVKEEDEDLKKEEEDEEMKDAEEEEEEEQVPAKRTKAAPAKTTKAPPKKAVGRPRRKVWVKTE